MTAGTVQYFADMNEITIKPKYSIGDKVYHITPESPVGIVINWKYYGHTKSFEYCIAFGLGDNETDWYAAHELNKNKLFYD